jgi:flagellar motility protein MotE (MotC chaperone)
MTSLVLHLWLLAAGPAAAPGAGLDPPPINPTVEVPAAPSPSAPPLPNPPGFPGSTPGSGPGMPPKRVHVPAAIPAEEKKASPQKREAKADSAAPPANDKTARPAAPAVSDKSAHPAAPAKRTSKSILPTLTAAALKGELHQSLIKPGETTAAPSDRVRLEQLAAEIAHAREALKQETTRLEALIKQVGPCGSEARNAPSESDPAAAAAAAAAKDAAREQLDSVSKTLKGMKPEQAAALVSLLEHRLAAEVIRRMRPADAGALMGYLKPEVAAALATEIATRKSTLAKKGNTP